LNDCFVKYVGPSPFFSMLRMNSPEMCYIIFGCVMCICNGGKNRISSFNIQFSIEFFKVFNLRSVLYWVN